MRDQILQSERRKRKKKKKAFDFDSGIRRGLTVGVSKRLFPQIGGKQSVCGGGVGCGVGEAANTHLISAVVP